MKTTINALLALCLLGFSVFAQLETPPAPSAPKSVSVPAVKESKLPNGLTVAVVERKNLPIVTVQLLIKSGAEREDFEKAGLANMTASLLTKGTKTRTASQIAEEMEFLGGSINTGAGWSNSVVSVNVMSDKLDRAMAIMSDVVLNPSFKQSEIDLLKTQTLDGLTYNLTQPGFLASYVSSVYSLYEHPAGGTPESLKNINRNDIAAFHKENFESNNAVLIFAGDITALQAKTLAQKYFGRWRKQPQQKSADGERKEIIQSIESIETVKQTEAPPEPILKRILVVDLPDAGQASVSFNKNVDSGGRIVWDEQTNKAETTAAYYPAIVMNSILGGGYSSRLNQEIRIKRGLSYGAGSSFAWRFYGANFGTRTQTKNESAAEVAELVLAEVNKLGSEAVSDAELMPRKSVLTGNFNRNLETTEGLAAAVADLYSFELSPNELNAYTKSVQSVADAKIREYAKSNLMGGDIVIVGDYAKFKDDLTKRFPNAKVEVVKVSELNLKRIEEERNR